ncbi:PH domain-containing protein [Patescibacteria group bacterium]|nr:PH domain-containing protein [Patescibacteria group bacterium]
MARMKSEKTVRGYFYPVMDWWLMVFCLLFLLFLIIAIPTVIWRGSIWWHTLLFIVALIGLALYVIDAMFFTKYQLQENGLAVYSQLRYFYFPYREMKSIQPGGLLHLFSFGRRKRFALSSNCLAISLAKGDWRVISVSPSDRQEFLNILLHNIDRERSKRATVSREQ